MAAPVGSNVSLYMDTPRDIQPGDYIVTHSGRSYLVDSVRIQQRGKHAGRKHMRVIVVDPATVPHGDDEEVIHPLFWYSRNRR